MIYVRVSTQEQVGNHSLDMQERLCREYCSRHGLTVAKVFREEGESAKTMDRTILGKLIDFGKASAKKEGITTLVVYKIDRLSRNTFDHNVIRYEMSKVGVVLRSTQEQIDETPEGLLMENLMASFAQFDNNIRARRTRAGMAEALSKGRWQWRAPVGYISTPKGSEGPSITPDPIKAPLVRDVFELIARGGHTLAEAREFATSIGLMSANGRPLTAERFNTMIRNPIYCGFVCSRAFDFRGPGDFEPLVTRDVFDRAQFATAGRVPGSDGYRLDHPDFPLRRALKCPQCGGSLTASWSTGRKRKYAYYRCPRRACRVNVKRDAMEALFDAFLQEQSISPRVFDLFSAVLQDSWGGRMSATYEAEKRLQKRLDEVDAKRQKLLDALVYREVIDRAEYALQSARIDSDETTIRSQLAALHRPQVSLDECLDFGRRTLINLAGTWNLLSAEQRPGFLEAMYPEGIIYTGEKIGTAQTPWYAMDLGGSDFPNAAKVPPTGFEPV
jgi:site-specific DNA recombinase